MLLQREPPVNGVLYPPITPKKPYSQLMKFPVDKLRLSKTAAKGPRDNRFLFASDTKPNRGGDLREIFSYSGDIIKMRNYLFSLNATPKNSLHPLSSVKTCGSAKPAKNCTTLQNFVKFNDSSEKRSRHTNGFAPPNSAGPHDNRWCFF